MNTYHITIKKLGSVVDSVMMTATNAAYAIELVEQNYDSKVFSLSDRAGNIQQHKWTGYEFEARNIKMELS